MLRDIFACPTEGARPVPQSPGPLVITSAHLTAALADAKKRAATAIGAPAIPDVRSGHLQRHVSQNSWAPCINTEDATHLRGGVPHYNPPVQRSFACKHHAG